MPQGNTHIPNYCRHKARDLAFVRLDGRTLYLGRYDTPESRAEYDRVVGLWTLNGRRLPQEFQKQEIPASALMTQSVRDISSASAYGPAPGVYTMAHLCGDYLTEMENRYQSKQGSRRTELGRIKTTLRPVVRYFGKEPAADFSPRKLKLVRQFFIDLGHVRQEINKRMRAIRKMMRWGVAEEHIPAETYMKFVEIEPLKPNDYGVKEPTRVKPVQSEMIEKTLPFLNRFIAAMVKVQLCTGARPEEICLMRGCDIERTERTWIYTPLTHKLAWRGQVRQIPIGPNAQAVLKDFLTGDPKAFLFSPRIAQEEHLAAASAQRKTPLSCGNVRGSKRKNNPLKEPGERYTPDSHWRAIVNACRKAFPLPDHLQRKLVTPKGRKRKPRHETVAEWRTRLTEEGLFSQVGEWEQEHRWFPYQIRHSAATWLRKKAGIEAAQVVLGHRHVKTTERYAEEDFELAKDAMWDLG
ncbi:MAG TPA: tyrosine-type recombinase/integrase [Phycisphaerae bacterium]|nr:tyrosine-type recombinase/integrase [Phycisphaerae bacterium]